MTILDIDDLGLDTTDRKLLAAIVQKFQSGPGRRPGPGRGARRGDRDRSRTSTSRSCCASASWTAPRRAGSPPRPPAPISRPWATSPRCRGARSRTCRPSGTICAALSGTHHARRRQLRGRSSRRRRTDRTRARLGRLTLPHGWSRPPQFMPVGTNATVKALHPDEVAAAAGASILLANTYHLYLRPGHERIERLGGLHRLHGLGPTDPDGLRRLPGGIAGRAAVDRRRRGHLQEPPRRVHPPVHARAFDRGPAGARAGHRRRVRPARVPQRAAGGRRGCDAPHPSLGGPLARGAHADGPGPVRHRPGRAGPGAARGVGAVHRRRCRSTASTSAAWRATRRPTSATPRWTRRAAPRRAIHAPAT